MIVRTISVRLFVSLGRTTGTRHDTRSNHFRTQTLSPAFHPYRSLAAPQEGDRSRSGERKVRLGWSERLETFRTWPK
jgi:hypothetical protein